MITSEQARHGIRRRVQVTESDSGFYMMIGTILRTEDSVRSDYLSVVVKFVGLPEAIGKNYIKFSPYELSFI